MKDPFREYVRIELEKIQQENRDRCPDHLSQAAIAQLARAHSRMSIVACQFCGCDCRQFDWNLDKPSTCKVCELTGGKK